MRILTTDQRTDGWRRAKLGMLGASDAGDLLAAGRSGGEAATRRDLRLRLVSEILTGRPQEDGYVNAAMQRGIDSEAAARQAYEALTGVFVDEVGFVAHDTLRAGCSPDGMIDGFTTLVEIKAPKSSTHLAYLRAGTVPSAYLPQLTHQLWITGAAAVDFFSWDDRFPPPLDTFLVRLERDERAIAAYADKVRAFLAEVDLECQALTTMRDVGAVLREAVNA